MGFEVAVTGCLGAAGPRAVRMGGVESSFRQEKSPAVMTYRNAVLTPQGCYRLVMRVQAGRPIACVAAEAIPGSTGQTNDAGKPILARSSSYMIHLDVKKVGRIPPGGGWRAHGRGTPKAKASKRGKGARIGYTYLHTAIDGFSRLAYTEALDDEKVSTTIGFFCRARAFFAAHGITRLVRVVTDNGANYRARTFTTTITSLASRYQRTRPYTPRHNGKVERYNRILAEECLYARNYSSEQQRRDAVAV